MIKKKELPKYELFIHFKNKIVKEKIETIVNYTYNIMKPLMWIMILGLSFRDVCADYCPQSNACSTTCQVYSRYYRACGFLWLDRCSRYRVHYYTCYETCYKQACCTGYTGSSCNTPLCDGSTSCPNGGTCRYPDYCVCPTGFSAPGCNDIDECSGTSHGCQHYCRNTAGSYYCTCRAGYVRSYDLKACTDIDECSGISHGCQQDCRNTAGSYYCTCRAGYLPNSDLKTCTDIQPPVLTGCSEDVHINATGHTVQYNWTEPIFTDPMGSVLEIVSNYPSPEFTFPWGDYTVQYVATKTSNGLRTECSFQVKVRPTPCEELNVPVNGARLCNGWKTDYGRFCMIMCQQNYTIGPAQSYYTWHVCGASGNWIAASPVPDCSVPVAYEYEEEYYHPGYAGYVYSSSCEDDATRNTLQTLYIDYLKEAEGFSSFCSTYESECTKENVDVKC
ncbi:fibrillin-1-like isoform X2 [Mercenaria mercenaria]|uniref:fibrillin-1-like isoform X2 n=1 Tax=Mercenaria mercenaria TaxID=6596 RepID=UPI00234F8B3B|nr:fibrillin-1-like isoform X2 [Mercenaria mercenaria]